MWLMLSNLPSRIKFISDFLIWGLVKMNMVIMLPMPPMILSRIRKGPLIKYPYRLAYPTNIWDYGEYNKVSFFLQCSKMQIIPLKKIIIQTCFFQFFWFFKLKCWFKGQIISRIHLSLPSLSTRMPSLYLFSS